VIHLPKDVLFSGTLGSQTGRKGKISTDSGIVLVDEVQLAGIDVFLFERREDLLGKGCAIGTDIIRPFVHHHGSVRVSHAGSGSGNRIEIVEFWRQVLQGFSPFRLWRFGPVTIRFFARLIVGIMFICGGCLRGIMLPVGIHIMLVLFR